MQIHDRILIIDGIRTLMSMIYFILGWVENVRGFIESEPVFLCTVLWIASFVFLWYMMNDMGFNVCGLVPCIHEDVTYVELIVLCLMVSK